MPPSLDDYSFAFGDMGTVLNTDSMGLPFIDVTSVSGLDAAPLRTTTDEHQGVDGTYVDSPYMSMRTIVVTGTLYTPPTDPDTLLKQLRADYNSNVVRPFYFQLPGQPVRFINGQGGGLQYNVDTNRRIGSTPVQFSVLCSDPYIYDYPAQAGSISVPAVISVGTGFNMAFNVGFGGSVPGNSVSVFNYGTHTAYPVITITGPVTNPVLIDAYGVTMPFTISLAASDSLVINCQNKSVVLNGTISRRTSLAGLKWFSVPAGMSESIFFSASAGTGSCTVSLNSTYY
jgi:Phage tail protein